MSAQPLHGKLGQSHQRRKEARAMSTLAAPHPLTGGADEEVIGTKP
jgi:hypothetical protein